jgi:hypothetical protein
MVKAPPNLPEVGDRVRLRGNDCVGKLVRLIPDHPWAVVEWDKDKVGARVVHLLELEQLVGVVS